MTQPLRGYDEWKTREPIEWCECPRCAEDAGFHDDLPNGELCMTHRWEAMADEAEDEADRLMEDRLFGEED